MGPLLIVLFALYQLQTSAYSELLDTPKLSSNALSEENYDDLNAIIPPEVLDNDAEFYNEKNDIPIVKSGREQTEVEFRHPISSVNIDYSKNVIVLKFRKEHPKSLLKLNPEEEQKRRSLESNFMCFGRTPSDFMRFGRTPTDFMRFGRTPADFMRFGKRQLEQLPTANSIDRGFYEKPLDGSSNRRFERSQEGIRDSRGDNFMRFGKSSKDFMRFGRSPADFMRLGRSSADFMRFGRSPADFMRLGRDGSNDFMRFGRSPADFMRLGRDASSDFMRFGRTQKAQRLLTDQNFMRFGRPDNFMRFGRAASSDSQESPNFMRFGKMDQNFMRFGKSVEEQQGKENQTEATVAKNAIKATAKLLRQTAQDTDELESNPMDKAIKVLYNKQQQQHQQQKNEAGDEAEVNVHNDDAETDLDYALTMTQ